MPAMHDFATWEPLLRILRADGARTPAAPGGHLAGRIGRRGWVRVPGRPRRGRADRAELDAVERVLRALADAEAGDVSFKAEISPTGATALHLLDPGPAVEPGPATVHPGALLLVEGALPEPWRRLPDPTPGAAPSPSADPALLERTLRARVPGARGAAEAEIAAAEKRLGVMLPGELKVLHRVAAAGRRGRGGDDEAAEHAEHLDRAVGCELLPLERMYVAHAPTRPCGWRSAARQVIVTSPGAAVQGLVGSPGWIVFAVGGGGDPIAVDLTPGPGGALGQIVLLDHEQVIGAELLADSLTDLVVNGRREGRRDRRWDRPPPGARTDLARLTNPRAAVDPRLEVLTTGGWQGAPLSLVPVMGLPRLRTLTASPGTLADPLEIARLTALEFLELGPQDWRVLLDAGAVPRGLAAAAIEVHRDQDPLPVVELANEILALRDRPPITRTVLHGDLGPA
ncbi:SMI1/KNR4 family protein [Streptomyces sp. NBC_01214]|uniref:SMI1/KNR4 family protein n=1 Tax=Streptomyces sp. NBC_01214 TaxID=2903777 RepID=UPI0022535B53|nr:SMI1/KNR4 family protein [Streptomyces sp. NBC_01214]MCX4806155.1 SMI1/KNR4 family protein [Streptomyces sp. NBC_01214]